VWNMPSHLKKRAFSIGFCFGLFAAGVLNYVTFLSPRWYRSPGGALIPHDPLYSGFPFAMYEHGYLSQNAVLVNGLVANVLVAIALSLLLGCLATKIRRRKVSLE
jgi:hypothetical protein